MRADTQHSILYALLGLYYLSTVIRAASIDSASSTLEIELGKTANFKCHVQNILDSDLVIWHFMEHNVTISVNDNITVQGLENRYSIYRPQDGGGSGKFYNLEISNVGYSDVGTYKCYIKDGVSNTSQVFHHLKVKGAPPKPATPRINVTNCCIEAGVAACALPLCDIAGLTSGPTGLVDLIRILSTGSCIDDEIMKILQCGQDGRNHLGCCIRSGIPGVCQDLCDAREPPPNPDYTSCIAFPTSLNIITCFEEGQVMLPGPPVSIAAIAPGTSTIVVYWKPPQDNPNVTTGYKVQYKKQQDQLYKSTEVLPPDTNIANIDGLEKNTVYDVNVIALAQSGSSQPSYTIAIATNSEDINPSQLNSTIQDCCIKKNISSECQPFCNANVYAKINPDSVLKCHSELDDLYSCLVGQANHTPCCERVLVPESCYPLCEGKLILTWDISQCLPIMPVISACLMEGATFLPSPPKNTHIVPGSTTSDSTTVAWDPPDNVKVGDYYEVSWKPSTSTDNLQWNSTEVRGGTRFEIQGLKSAAVYDIVVASVNSRGSSLPELTLIIVTEGIDNTVVPLLNETECCVQKGVTTNCLSICDHRSRIGLDLNALTMLGIGCINALYPMLLCATDGRDHTACCKREGIVDPCLDLCKLTPDFDEGNAIQFVGCLPVKDKLSICFDEGKDVLPKAPTELTVKHIEQYSMVLSWKAPTGPNITNYVVEMSQDYRQWEMLTPNTTETFMTIDHLEPETGHYFHVFAQIDNNGTYIMSLASNIVKAMTLAVPVSPGLNTTWTALWNNRTECCNKTVSSGCNEFCMDHIQAGHDYNVCAPELDKIITCGADGRDHTKCCIKYPEFPETCLPYCKGQTPQRNVLSALCLMYFPEISTCFTDGQGLLPTPPTNVRVTNFTQDTISVAWNMPTDNCQSETCKYEVMYWESAVLEKIVTKKLPDTTDLKVVVDSLKSGTTYYISILAKNSKGQSLPSPSLIVTTQGSSLYRISVSRSPSGIIDIGSFVTLECVSMQPALNFTWYHNDKIVSTSSSFTIPKVAELDEKLYTCMVFYDKSNSMKASLSLNIRYAPKGLKMTKDEVIPGVNQDASLTCTFSGFPDIITWTKENQALTDITKYYMEPLQTDTMLGTTTSVLRVKSVVIADHGSYTCFATNKFGNKTITGTLSYYAPTKPPPVLPPTNNLTECCRAQNIPDICVTNICSFSLDLEAIVRDTSLFECLGHLEPLLACGSDGKNHSKCCRKAGVEEYCLPFCEGRIPDHVDTWHLTRCVTHLDVYTNCSAEGTANIPSAPQNVKAIVTYDEVEVLWDVPLKNAQKVDLYVVSWVKEGSTEPVQTAQLSDNTKSFKLSNVKEGDVFTVWVVAHNNFGSSINSKNDTITVTELTPTQPLSLKGTLVNNVAISLTWSPPRTTAKVKGYAIKYQSLVPLGDEQTARSPSARIRLEKLNEVTEYEIYVVALNENGSPGEKSNMIKITTGKVVPGSGTVDSLGGNDSGQTKTGLAVGLVLAIVLLVAIGFVAILMYRRMARKKMGHEISENVAFENPSYATNNRDPKISGLPGDSTGDSNQFGYDQLAEDRDVLVNNGYETHASLNNDSPPILNLDHQSTESKAI